METEPLWQFWSDWIVQVAIAFGTISAVVIALFRNWLRAWIAPPRLVLKLDNERGSKVPAIIRAPSGTHRETDSRYYHVTVGNERRWFPATQVQIFLLRMEEPDAAGQYKMTWVGEVPIRWRHQEIQPLVKTIGYDADCDLCSVVKEKWLELHPLIRLTAWDPRHRESCHLIVTLQARGVESDSNLLRVQIDWDGGWADDTDEMAKHAVVKVLSEGQ